jgi:hypothetical protein
MRNHPSAAHGSGTFDQLRVEQRLAAGQVIGFLAHHEQAVPNPKARGQVGTSSARIIAAPRTRPVTP